MRANHSSGNVLAWALAVTASALTAASCAAGAHRQPTNPAPVGCTTAPGSSLTSAGRSLFLRNCAHCHGDDARGDEGPDLHGLRRSDEWLGRRIRQGIKGEMPAFGEKFGQDDVDALIAFLHTLR